MRSSSSTSPSASMISVRRGVANSSRTETSSSVMISTSRARGDAICRDNLQSSRRDLLIHRQSHRGQAQLDAASANQGSPWLVPLKDAKFLRRSSYGADQRRGRQAAPSLSPANRAQATLPFRSRRVRSATANKRDHLRQYWQQQSPNQPRMCARSRALLSSNFVRRVTTSSRKVNER